MRPVFLPHSIEEALGFLRAEPKAAIYAGGTDLLVKMRSGAVNFPALICLERVDELKEVHEDGDDVLIGAATTHTGLLEDPLVRDHFPVLTRAARVLGSPPVRNMGTIGGNIVTASPAGDTLPPLYVLDADVEIRSWEGTRRAPVRDFILGPGVVDLKSHELVTAIGLRKSQQWDVHHYEKVGRRKSLACAVVSLAALMKLGPRGEIDDVRLAWGGVGPTVVTSAEVEVLLRGKPLSYDTLKSAVPPVERAVSPIDDTRASAEYRRIVSGNLLFRLLEYVR